MSNLLNELVSLLKKYPGPRLVIEKVFSMALNKLDGEGTLIDGEMSFCPDCGGKMIVSGGGCDVCRDCGFSRCG